MNRTSIALASVLALNVASGARADAVPDEAVLAAQEQRAEAVARACEATIAIFDAAGAGGGSGVIISPDGFALTNFHVTAPCGPAMKCGLPDGKLYDAVIVGIDPVGDVALIQLLGRDDFPVAQIGDSDKVRVGDWAIVAGNPFLLADDFQPTVTYGMISGVRRYQFPAGTLLEYADCLQTDAAINPGNSGGPLFDAEGRLIGINGRGSFEKRGRVNVGVGYAISINQVMRFLGHLKSGRIVDHATLGATVSTEADGQVMVNDILETSDAFRRGLQYGDGIVEFAGRDIRTANALKNALGVYPSGWRVPLTFRREGVSHRIDVRLASLHDESELLELVQSEGADPNKPPEGEPPKGDQDGEPKGRPKLPIPGLDALLNKPKLPPAVAKRYEARRGYANYWYNAQAQDRLWRRYLEQTSAARAGYDWQIAGVVETGIVTTGQPFTLDRTILGGDGAVRERLMEMGQPFALDVTEGEAHLRLPTGSFNVLFEGDAANQLSPPRSGGLLLALHAWQNLLDKGLRRYGEVYYLGTLPHGPNNRAEDCLVGYFEGMETRYFFSTESGDLTGIELFAADDADPCEIAFSEFTTFEGRRLPRRWQVRHGNSVFVELLVSEWQFKSPDSATPQAEK